ncbi:MAG: 30S ribosomal protein S12 methylthiotransferase RimO [Actinobacteria bacterium]|nr:30S ribosomal protein S12 methylthiotransferase RimO [Actinomycetota bacterium]
MTEAAGRQDPASPPRGSVAVVTLGCARNEVDSEELAGRLAEQGWQLTADPVDADVAVVNTCGFIAQAKKDSIDALLEAADLKGRGRTRAVVAVGCLAERYGAELAAELPEADAVLGFDSYADLSSHLATVLAGGRPAAHQPTDRRGLLPLSPVARPDAARSVMVPGHGVPTPGATRAGAADLAVDPAAATPGVGAHPRLRLDDRPWAPLKIASGCDRRCTFCAIPAFRGSFVSRPPADLLAEARWLADQGVRELFLVSENSTSYGKDLGDLRLLDSLLPELAAVEGIDRVRVSYLQPAELRPALLHAIAGTRGVAPYFDLSFQHASEPVLRRMRRFGSAEAFLELIERVRQLAPTAGLRANVIVGFPGETARDVEVLAAFLAAARLDVCGVFGYSDEDGTEAQTLPDKVAPEEIEERFARISSLVEELTAQRAEERWGERVVVLVEEIDQDGTPLGRAAHQGPDVDGICQLIGDIEDATPGRLVRGEVVGSEGADLVVELS